MEHPKDMRVAFEAFGCVERQQLVVILPASDSESICYLNGIYVYAALVELIKPMLSLL